MNQFNHDHYLEKRKIVFIENEKKEYSLNGDSFIHLHSKTLKKNFFIYNIMSPSQVVFSYYNEEENQWSYNDITINLYNDCELFFLALPNKNKIKNKITIKLFENVKTNIICLSQIIKEQIHDDSFEIIHSNKSFSSIKYQSFVEGEIVSQINSVVSENCFNSETHQKIEHIMVENSKVYSKPNLDINNKNTIASHGNSISPINKDILFYLNQRGINLKESQQIIKDNNLKYFFSLIREKDIIKEIKELYDNKK